MAFLHLGRIYKPAHDKTPELKFTCCSFYIPFIFLSSSSENKTQSNNSTFVGFAQIYAAYGDPFLRYASNKNHEIQFHPKERKPQLENYARYNLKMLKQWQWYSIKANMWQIPLKINFHSPGHTSITWFYNGERIVITNPIKSAFNSFRFKFISISKLGFSWYTISASNLWTGVLVCYLLPRKNSI